MSLQNNRVGHCTEGTSDKVYIASVKKNADGTWTSVGKWGARGSTLKSQPKLENVSENRARASMHDLFHSKLRGGYEDVESSSYKGDVVISSSYIQSQLEPENVAAVTTPVPIPKSPPVPPAKKDPRKARITVGDTAICIDNLGMEDRFDLNIEYVVEEHKEDDMLWVYDKRGAKVECLKERFNCTHSLK